ncbi:MAG TPA: helix-turn-helix transcriptional regulator [Jiangellaceae bacterium]|nr:helix-turn-helix transcriptional regulator [Jiangellaceae bacterium]
METPQVPGDLSHRLVERRRVLGLSRAQVARRARMAERCVRQLEQAQVEATPAVLWRLAAALETTPMRLIGAGPSTLAAGSQEDDAGAIVRR